MTAIILYIFKISGGPCIFIDKYSLYIPTNAHTHIYTYIYIYICVYIYIERERERAQNYFTSAPTCFGTSAPSSGSLYIVFPKVIKY